MKSYSISDMKAGYFIGNFNPSVFKTTKFEISLKKITRGAQHLYYRKIDIQLIVLLRGVIWADDKKNVAGTVILFNALDIVDLLALTDALYICIRFPGTQNDIYRNVESLSKINDYNKLCIDSRKFIRRRLVDDRCDFLENYGYNFDDRELTVLIQGYVYKEIMRKNIDHIRLFMPNSKIIISTWHECDCEGLEADYIIKNDDPGGVKCGSYYWEGQKHDIINNCNRQIMSTKNGLKRVSTSYVLKLRSDQIILSDNILKCFSKNKISDKRYGVFFEKILVGELYTRSYYVYGVGSRWSVIPTPFHVSDWFMFGRTDDVKKIYEPLRLMLNTELSGYNYKYPERLHEMGYTCSYRYPPEQYIMMGIVKSKFPKVCFDDLTDWNAMAMDLSVNFIAANFTILNYLQSQILNVKYKHILEENDGIEHLIPGLVYAKPYKS